MHDYYNKVKERKKELVRIIAKEDKKLNKRESKKLKVKQKMANEKKVFKDLRKAIEEGNIEEAVILLNK